MIRAAGRSSSVRNDAKTTGSSVTPATWRSSLRSKSKETNQNGIRVVTNSGNSIHPDKANLTAMDRKESARNSSTSNTGHTKSEPRRSSNKNGEIADKARKKFMENLSKFQRESSTSDASHSSPFQRSYRKGGRMTSDATANGASYRHSCRAPTVTARVDTRNLGTRRSLRRDRIPEQSVDEEKSTSTRTVNKKQVNVVQTKPPVGRSSERLEKSVDPSTRKPQTGRTSDGMNSTFTDGSVLGRPSSSSSVTSSTSSGASSVGGGKPSRAQLAMERHMERMRKASLTSPPAVSSVGSQSPVSVSRSKSRSELENEAPVAALKHVLKEKRPSASGATSTDTTLRKVEEDRLWHESIGEDWTEIDFDEIIRSGQVCTSPDAVSAPSERKSSAVTPALNTGWKPPTNQWNSVHIIEDNVFDILESGSISGQGSQPEVEIYQTPTVRRTSKNSTARAESSSSIRSLGPRDPVDHEMLKSPEVKSRKKSDSLQPSNGWHEESVFEENSNRPRDVDKEINLNVDAAIDTFRRLSEEVDTMKHRGFAPNAASKAQSPKPKKKVSPKDNSEGKRRAGSRMSATRENDDAVENISKVTSTATSHRKSSRSTSSVVVPPAHHIFPVSSTAEGKLNNLKDPTPDDLVAQSSHDNESVCRPVSSANYSQPSPNKSETKSIAVPPVPARGADQPEADRSSAVASVNEHAAPSEVAPSPAQTENVPVKSPTDMQPVTMSFRHISEKPGIDRINQVVQPSQGDSIRSPHNESRSRQNVQDEQSTLLSQQNKHAPRAREKSAGNNYPGNASQSGAHQAKLFGEKSAVTSPAAEARSGASSGSRLVIEEIGEPKQGSVLSAAGAGTVNQQRDSTTATLSVEPGSDANTLPTSTKSLKLSTVKASKKTISDLGNNMSTSTAGERAEQAQTFWQLSAAERRKRLRRAALKLKQDSQSSDDESVFSDGHSSDSDYSSSWLDSDADDSPAKNRGKSKACLISNKSRSARSARDSTAKPHKTEDEAPESSKVGPPATARLTAIWETKLEETKAPVTSTPKSDLSSIRGKNAIGDAKQNFEPPKTPERQNEASNEQDEQEAQNGNTTKLGSMLSMWENKKIEAKSGYNAAEDEAFDKSTMGRLQGAKALFQNMSKSGSNNGSESSSPSLTSPSHTSRKAVGGAKNMFENLAKSSSASSSPKRTPIVISKSSSAGKSAPARKISSSDESDFGSDLSDADTLSSTSSSENEFELREGNVCDVKDMWERKSSEPNIKTSHSDEIVALEKSGAIGGIRDIKTAWEAKAESASDSESATESTEPSTSMMGTFVKRPVPKSSPRSNIQKRISAKKRARRSMTQPVTGDDVSAAAELVREQRSYEAGNSEQDREKSAEEGEEVLSFSERLCFFNKICDQVSTPARKSGRGSGKRHRTQPVELEAVVEARKKLLEESSKDSASPPSVEIIVPRDRVRKISESIECRSQKRHVPCGNQDLVNSSDQINLTETSQPAAEDGKPRKIKSKVLESKLSSTVEPNRKDSKSPVAENLLSEEKSPHSRDRSLSPSRIPPLSPSSSGESEEETEDMGKLRETEIKSTGSIRDRMKLLQKNQEEDWKRRVKKDNQSTIRSKLGDRMNKLQENEEKWKNPSEGEKTSSGGRASVLANSNIADRLNSIMSNSENWKTKTGKQNDATQFTVHAKMAKRNNQNMVPIVPSPSIKKRVLPVAARDEPVITVDDLKSDGPGLNKLSGVLKLARKGLEPDVIKKTEESTTEIPDIVDEDFENFFSATRIEIDDVSIVVRVNGVSNGDDESGTEEPVLPSWLDEEHHVELSNLGHLKRGVQRGSRNRGSVRNPVKALAAREDIKQSYTEQRSNVIKLEQQRLASRFGHGSHFTSAALAGLAHKADFSKVNLRSTKKSAFSASDLQPWQDKMLLRVKGRRRVQTRLVEPKSCSLNSGDAYLLILSDKMYAWFGEFSNVIERAKVQEIADYIIHQGDMGSKASSLTILEEGSSSSIVQREFWNLIGGKDSYDPSGGADEDEAFEVNAETTIKTYKLEDSKLVPHQPAWGKFPTMGMLNTADCFVFDFGAEMYIWQGKEVSFDKRQLTVKLARALWDQGYDYKDIGFCPFVPSKDCTNLLAGPRPEWGLFARVNENLETALVQEKFEDWSNIHREIGEREEILKETSRGQVAHEQTTKTTIRPEMELCDVIKMKKTSAKPLPLILEGYNIWRGYGQMYDDDGRGLDVVTSSVDCWVVDDKCMEKIEEAGWGVFHRHDTYVIRWRYVISATGKWLAEKGGGGDLKKDPKGRERTAYFLWSGRESSVNEKGASALMATEIDKEGGTQIVATEGREPPAMVQCFKGKMMVIDGKRGKREGFYSWKLYCVRGNAPEEVSLHQVPCESSSLRSTASFVALNARQSKVVVWHGCASPEKTQIVAEFAAKQIQESKKVCLGFRASCKSVELAVCSEGSENEDFTEAMLRIRRTKYVSLLEANTTTRPPPRAWQLLPSGDEFISQELPPVSSTNNDVDKNCGEDLFPFVQEQLQELTRPALVLLENTQGVYLWQSANTEAAKGSAKRQYNITRRLAMETAIAYCKEHRAECEATVVHEHHEPLEFTNSFPYWRTPEDKYTFEEKRAKKPVPVSQILKTLSKLTYTIEELRAAELPEGVDPNHLETYLSLKDFVDLFEMSKEEFYEMPPWKQQKLRKEKKLY